MQVSFWKGNGWAILLTSLLLLVHGGGKASADELRIYDVEGGLLKSQIIPSGYDLRLDVLFTSRYEVCEDADHDREVGLLLNNGKNRFAPVVKRPGEASFHPLRAGDFRLEVGEKHRILSLRLSVDGESLEGALARPRTSQTWFSSLSGAQSGGISSNSYYSNALQFAQATVAGAASSAGSVGASGATAASGAAVASGASVGISAAATGISAGALAVGGAVAAASVAALAAVEIQQQNSQGADEVPMPPDSDQPPTISGS